MSRQVRFLSLTISLSVFLAPTPASAIRPFVTDDARVVGKHLAQLETWLMVDRLAFEHNALAAVGPTPWLELTAGFVQGANHSGAKRGYTMMGPILQAKALILPAHDNSWPGLAIAAGALAPAGIGSLRPQGWGGFVYGALTQSFCDEAVLIHVNLGFAAAVDASIPNTGSVSTGELSASVASRTSTLLTSGIGVQTHIYSGLHTATEIFYGDPFDPRSGYPAMQVGLRYIFSEHVQMDGTFGSTLVAVPESFDRERIERWGSMGIRLVTPELW